jgi:hypothetical protein
MNTPVTIIGRKSAQNQSIRDVIISGAGPVGLFLACELALAECSVLILEQAENPHSPLKQLPFGIRGLSAPSVEALYRRGLLNELELHKRIKNPHQNAGQGSRRQVGHFAGPALRHITLYQGGKAYGSCSRLSIAVSMQIRPLVRRSFRHRLSSNVFGMAVPALFTRTSSRPKVATVFSIAALTALESAASA